MSLLHSRIAQHILVGFDVYRARFQDITRGARSRFEQARWVDIQEASTARINMYEECVKNTARSLNGQFELTDIMDVNNWPHIREAYIGLIDPRLDGELAETWYNSIFCRFHRHELISDNTMFVHTTRPATRPPSRIPLTRGFISEGSLEDLARQILEEYSFDTPWHDFEGDCAKIVAYLKQGLPEWAQLDRGLTVEIIQNVFYRNKGAYLVGRLLSQEEQWPFVLPLVHRENQGISVDTLITDEAEVSIIFSFTRSYFMVDAPVPWEMIHFIKRLIPGKHIAELYTAIGFYKQGKHGLKPNYSVLCDLKLYVLEFDFMRRVLRNDSIQCTVSQSLEEGLRISFSSEWRVDFVIAVETSQMHVSQQKLMGGDISSDLYALRFGLPDKVYTLPCADGRKMQGRLMVFCQLQISFDHQTFGQIWLALHSQKSTHFSLIHLCTV